MTEQAVTFGGANHLIGVIAEPDLAGDVKNAPGVLLLNAGLLHRVGPYRLYVELARKLSSIGFYVLRFDLSGIGDSLQDDDARLYDERILDNISEAMDLLSVRFKIEEFVLMGLCAGADNAHKAALNDKRVVGAVFLDGYGYRTCGYYLRHYGPRFFRLQPWKRFLKRRLLGGISYIKGKTEGPASRGEIFVRKFPPKRQVTREIQDLVDRGVSLFYVYSGGVKHSYYNHCGQFKAMFRSVDFQGRIETQYFDRAEHTYPSVRDRENLITTVCKWMRKHYWSGRLEQMNA